MTDPKADCEALLNSTLPFAEEMLAKHEEFFPYGAAMKVSGEIVSAAGYTGSEHPSSSEVIRLIKDGFSAEVRAGKFKATALVYDVRTIVPHTGQKSDAGAVGCDHVGEYSVEVMFPYKLDRGKVAFGEAFARAGNGDIFQKK